MSEALGLILPALQRWRWEDQKLKGTAGYIRNQGQRGILRPYLRKKKLKHFIYLLSHQWFNEHMCVRHCTGSHILGADTENQIALCLYIYILYLCAL